MMSTEPENNNSTPPVDPPSLVSSTGEPLATPPEQQGSSVDPNTDPNKAAEPAAPAVEPLKAEDIKLPEGFALDDPTRDSLLSALNDDKLTPQERGQKLVDLGAQLVQKVHEDNYKLWTDQQTAWQDEVRTDPEIGGDKLAPTLGEISKLVDKYGTPEVRQIMDSTGAGNNIHIVRMLSKIAKDLSEGSPVSGGPAQAKESLADRLYPSMKPKQGA